MMACSSSLLIVLLSALSWKRALAAGPIYGTSDGYDVGGNNSVCIVTTIDDGEYYRSRRLSGTASAVGSMLAGMNARDPGAANEAIQKLNEALFSGDPPPPDEDKDFGPSFGGEIGPPTGVNPVQVELLSQCYNGTFVKLEALDLESGYSIYRDFPYTFRIHFRMKVTDIVIFKYGLPAYGLFIRFAMCDALNRGFCNPVMESKSLDNLTVAMISNMTTTDTLIGISDPTTRTVFSQWAFPTTVDAGESDEIEIENLDLKFQVPQDTPKGLYRFVMHSMLVILVEEELELYNKTFLSLKRLDTATKGDVPILAVADDPEILQMSNAVKLVIYAAIGAYDLFVLVVLGFLIRFRNHDAVRLAQGPLLGALLVGALIGGTFTFSFMPEKNVYCFMRGPLVILPFTFIGAILVARLWRVYVTLSGAMKLGKSPIKEGSKASRVSDQRGSFSYVRSWNLSQRMVDVLTFFAKMNIFRCNHSKQQRSAMHRQIATNAESAQLVFFLVMPQALLQIVGLAIYTPRLELIFDDSGSLGRYYCDRDASWVDAVGSLLASGMFILAVVLAWVGRDIPSIFNEKDVIFHTATIAALVILINLVVMEITDEEFTSPDSSVFLRCVTLLFVGTIITSNVVYPKIARARRGEKVVVGKLLRAYGNNPSESEQQGVTDSAQRTSTFIAGEPIKLRKDDPLPGNIESQIHQLHTFFRGVSDKCASGRVLSRAEWEQMTRSIAKLKTDLDRVTLEWDNDSVHPIIHPADSGGMSSRCGGILGNGTVEDPEYSTIIEPGGSTEISCPIALEPQSLDLLEVGNN